MTTACPRAPSVDRALDLIELVSVSADGLTLSEISRKLQIPKSTAHYLVNTLQTRGYIYRRLDGHRYLLGQQIQSLNGSSVGKTEIGAILLPHLQLLANRTNLTAMASVKQGAEAVIIAQADVPHSQGRVTSVGRHLDLHCTAQGKAILAFLLAADVDRIFAARELAFYTRWTILSLSSLRAHLAEVRTAGFAVNDQEHVLGVRAVACPVFDNTHSPAASLGLSGLTTQISDSRLQQLGQALFRAATDVSRQMCDRGFTKDTSGQTESVSDLRRW